MVFLESFINKDEERIPEEKPLPQNIMIPTSTYINNYRHWSKYRCPAYLRKRSFTEMGKSDISITNAKDMNSTSIVIGKDNPY